MGNPFVQQIQLNPGDPSANAYQIQQAQALAKMLQDEAIAPIEQPRAPMARASPLAILAKGLQGYLAGTQQDKATDALKQNDALKQDKIDSLTTALTGTGHVNAVDDQNPGFDLQQKQAMPGDQPFINRDRLVTALGGMGKDDQSSALTNLMMQRALPSPGFSGKLSEGETAYVNGRPVAQGGHKPTDELAKLNEDHDRGLISDADYAARKNMMISRVDDMTPVGKLNTDLKAGRISLDQFNALYAKETHLPAGSQVVPSTDENGKPTLNLIATEDHPGVPAGGIIRKNVGVPASSNASSARAQMYTNRVVAGAGEASKDIQNIVSLPFGSSTGIMGIGSNPGHSIFSVGADNLKNTLSDQETQSYNTTIPGLAAAIATVESQGLAPSKARMESFNGLMLKPGDTGFTRLEKMANLRQNVEQGTNALLSDPKVPDEQKELVKNLMAELKAAVPFNFSDVQKLKQSKNPSASIGDYIKQQGLGDSKTTPPAAALDYLKQHPEAAPAFKAKYGYLP
jgi:hypothetical protein